MVAPQAVVTVNAVTTVPRALFDDGQATVRYLITSDRGFRQEVDFLLLGPFGHEEKREEKRDEKRDEKHEEKER